MSHDDTSYYRQRAVTERALALAAERQNVREIHQELARQYEALATQVDLRPTLRWFASARERQSASAL
jgi:predicted glycoside hydrolase/deacetylase ChbG (UPF0249 family)